MKFCLKELIPTIQLNAKVIAMVDALCSFASVTESNNYVRPKLSEKRELKIILDRHPVVEKVINTEYVPNDIIMDENTDILLIT